MSRDGQEITFKVGIFNCKEKINNVINALKLPPFEDTELLYIKEYISVLQPVAEALDRFKEKKTPSAVTFSLHC